MSTDDFWTYRIIWNDSRRFLVLLQQHYIICPYRLILQQQVYPFPAGPAVALHGTQIFMYGGKPACRIGIFNNFQSLPLRKANKQIAKSWIEPEDVEEDKLSGYVQMVTDFDEKKETRKSLVIGGSVFAAAVLAGVLGKAHDLILRSHTAFSLRTIPMKAETFPKIAGMAPRHPASA